MSNRELFCSSHNYTNSQLCYNDNMISNDVYKYCGDDVSLIENYDEAIADST